MMELNLSIVDWLGLLLHFMTLSLLAVGGGLSVVPGMHRYLVVQQADRRPVRFFRGAGADCPRPQRAVCCAHGLERWRQRGRRALGDAGRLALPAGHCASQFPAHLVCHALGAAQPEAPRGQGVQARHDAVGGGIAGVHRMAADLAGRDSAAFLELLAVRRNGLAAAVENQAAPAVGVAGRRGVGGSGLGLIHFHGIPAARFVFHPKPWVARPGYPSRIRAPADPCRYHNFVAPKKKGFKTEVPKPFRLISALG